MRIHHYRGQYITTHGDELPHLEIEPPTPFARCMAALALLLVACAVVGVLTLVILAPGEWKAPLIAVGLVAVWMMGRGGARR